MISTAYGDKAMRLVISEMRLMTHPAKRWEIDFRHGEVRGIAKVLPVSQEVVNEALAEVDALSKDQPAKPYERAVPNQAGIVRHQF